MTKLIAFDTSAAHCAAALLLGDRMITRIDDMARGQAEHLMPMLEGMLFAEGLTWTDLDGIGVCTGPGNFTGIRISIAAARGLALGLGKKAVGVSLFAAHARGNKRPLNVALPAPRGQHYVRRYRDPLPPETYIHAADQPLPATISLKPPADMIADLAHIAAARLVQPNITSPAPLYLRPADAAPAKDAAPVILE